MSTEFRVIPGYQGKYRISRSGEVLNSKGNHINAISVCGVEAVELYADGLRELKPISTLILETFKEERHD